VFECAIEEFQRVGIENAQIEPIVKRAGVSVGTFYRYFINREDVLHELQRRNATIMLDRFAGLKKTTNFRSYLKQIVSALLIDAPSSKMMLEREVLGLLVKHPPEHDYENHPVFGAGRDQNQSGPSGRRNTSGCSSRDSLQIFFSEYFWNLCRDLKRAQKTRLMWKRCWRFICPAFRLRKNSVAKRSRNSILSQKCSKVICSFDRKI